MTHSFPTRRSSDLVDQPDTDRAQKQIDRDRRANRTAQCLEKGSQQQGVAGTVESLLAVHIRELAAFGEALGHREIGERIAIAWMLQYPRARHSQGHGDKDARGEQRRAGSRRKRLYRGPTTWGFWGNGVYAVAATSPPQ